MLRRIFIVTVLFAMSSVSADVGTNEFCYKGVAEFSAAYRSWDAKRFGVAAELFRRATKNAPDSSASHYWLGVAEFHRMLQLERNGGKAANKAAIETARDAAESALSIAVTLNDRDAESHALLGTLHGMKINGSWFGGLRHGPSVVKHQELALKHGASNPRVQYLLGAAQFHTAGKADEWSKALRSLQVAETLFQKEASTAAVSLEPRWGYSTCLTFIGLAFEKLGQPVEAAGYFRKALEMHPRDSAAREGLQRVTGKE